VADKEKTSTATNKNEINQQAIDVYQSLKALVEKQKH
jgi:hypothetical protein